MSTKEPLMEYLSKRGVTRRSFLKFCAVTSSALALPPGADAIVTKPWHDEDLLARIHALTELEPA